MKKLFGCVRVCLLLLPVLLVLCTITGVRANNIRVEGKTRIVNFVGTDTAVIEVTLRWDNSWRDDFNWDAAWVFFKYKKRGLSNPWQHVYLSSSGHVLNPSSGNEGGGYAYMVGANGGKVNGLYVMRNGISEGNVSVRLQAKWCLSGTGLTKSDFGDALNGIYVAVHAIEMVYIPYGAYYLGDNYSNHTFASVSDLINQGTCTASSTYSGYPAQNALPGNSGYWCSARQGSEEWWQIKFAQPQVISSFALGVYAQVQYGYLEGSNSGQSGDWVTLWSGGSNCFPVSSASSFSSYCQVASPTAYSYYRIRMKSNSYSGIYALSLRKKESPFVIDSEDALTLSTRNGMPNVSLAASYPKGYAGFYVMKYETSQEQYVEFLNSLTLEQQKARVTNNNFSTMKRGDYVFGDLHTPSCRNGIVFVEQRQPNTPVVFGNNLNPNNDLFSTDDGQTLACNYMSVEDMIAYCSWSGLRPMSELEYEKACRRFYPQVPDKGEYAWNTNGGVNALSSLGDLAYVGDEREQANSAAKNVNSGTTNSINGPVRCGLFATSATNQTQAGATYWGVMEMSGNLKELCVSVGNPNFIGSSCGTGVYNAAYWNTAVGSYGVRGGGFLSADSTLRTSDRSEAMNYFTSITQRDSTVGFRGVYNLSGIKIDGGKIQGDTTCPGSEKSILNILEASCPDFPDMHFQYNWYVKKPGEAKYDIVDNATNKTLKYENFENTTNHPIVYTFKRTAICAIGVAESKEVTVTILPAPFAQEVYDFNAGSSVTLTQYWGMNASAQWWLDGAPSWAYVLGTTANSLTIAGGLANLEFQIKGKLAECPSDEFSATVRINNTFAYTGHVDSVTLTAGKYKVECWGARGGSGDGYNGGNGGYAKGDIVFNIPRVVYLYVGGSGVYGRISYGGWNGGGGGNHQNSAGGGGGGATDVRLVNGVWNDFQSLKSRIMVAAGGGGCGRYQNGGVGGGLQGGYGSGSANQGAPGTQTSGAGFGMGGNKTTSTNTGNGGGGSGYYGGFHGNANDYNATGGGGSSFISGHSGCNAISAASTAANIIHTGQPTHYSGLSFSNTSMTAGARAGHGQVKITPVN